MSKVIKGIFVTALAVVVFSAGAEARALFVRRRRSAE